MGSAATGPTVIHVVERLAPGGIETFVLDLIRLGSGSDKVFSLSGPTETLLTGWPALARYARCVESFGRRPGIDVAVVWRMALRLGELKPAAVVVHHIGPLVYGGLAAAFARVPLLVHVEHDGWHYRQPRRRFLMSALSRLLGPRHVAVSQQVAEIVQAIVPGPVSVIRPGVDLQRFRPADQAAARNRLQLGAGWKIIGTVGRLSPEKGQDVLVRALARLPDEVHVVIAGSGTERARLESEAFASGVADRVHFLGQRDDVELIYPAFDVFCLPSHLEGLPRSVLEAQACAVPVIATRVGALAEAVCPRTGLLVAPGDQEALAQAAAAILARPPGGASPRGHVEAGLSLADAVANLQRVLNGS